MASHRRDLAAEVIERVASASTAPASLQPKSDEAPSSRPTSIPDVDMDALAAGSFRTDLPKNAIQLDLVIPIRAGPETSLELSSVAASVFAQVDGYASLA